MDRYRFHPEAAVYYLTYSIVDWLPVFVTETSCKTITDSLTFCHHQKHLRINAFVIMPTHLHLIVFDADFNNERLIPTLADFRKYTGHQLSDYCISHGPPCFLDTIRAKATIDRERRFWQPSRHAVAIERESVWQQKLDYLHENPCRKGLVRNPMDWRYSSATWYASDGTCVTDVPMTPIEW
jgi:REP element-mobilizing transposase RayT